MRPVVQFHSLQLVFLRDTSAAGLLPYKADDFSKVPFADRHPMLFENHVVISGNILTLENGTQAKNPG